MTQLTIAVETLVIGNGAISYVNEVPATDRTVETRVEGNVTVNNITEAREAVPGYFEVNHFINSKVALGGISVTNMFTLHSALLGKSGASYNEIEDLAAHQLPVVLGALADEVEKTILDTDKTRKEASLIEREGQPS